jgi:membrane protease YdiL (CAAX protease family)
LLERIQRRFPPQEQTNHLVELFFEASGTGRIAMGIAIVLIGPWVEELIFRGAIFGPMAKGQRMSTVIVATSAIFALVHVEPTVMLPIFLLGLAMGYLRAASGSLVPSMLFHTSFNGTQFIDLYTYDAPPSPTTPPESLPPWLTLSASGAFALAFVGAILLARYSADAARARKAALDC